MAIGEDTLNRLSSGASDRALLALLELSRSLNEHGDVDALLRVIVEKASSVVDAERTSVFVYDEEHNRLWSKVAQGLGTSRIELPLGAGIAGDVAQTKTTANIADAYADPRFDPSTDQRTGYHTLSVVCVPVLGGAGNLLGVIQSVNKKNASHFGDGDVILMRALASHVAVALERARAMEMQLRNQALEQALRLASEIQMRMLPPPIAAAENGSWELAALLRPAKDVGGDLYDYFTTGDHLFFCIGDVSGKGAGAALVMAMTKTLFRANGALRPDPSDLLAAMSSQIYEETDESMFVTAVCASLNLADGTLRFASAGHDWPFLLAAGTGESTPLECHSGIPLGVFPSFKYQTTEARVQKGDAILLFTDGVTEATTRDERLFGLDRLKEALGKVDTREPAAVIARLDAAVDDFVQHGPQADDLTMLCIRWNGNPG